MPAGRPPKYETPEEMQEIIDAYFEGDAYMGEGDAKVFAPTVSGLALALDMSTEALRNYQDKDEFLATIKKAKQKVEVALEQRLHGQAVTGTIFNLKNNFGWKDKTEQELTGKDGGPIAVSEVTFVGVSTED
jgi:hypothetical protein